MEEATVMGTNKTGADMSPRETRKMEEVALADDDAPDGETDAVSQLRSRYVQEAERIGSIPPPGTLRGVVSTGLNKLTGKHPEVLIDKLGERCAFERTGTRLYEAMLMKCRALEAAGDTVPIADLQRIRDEEEQHFLLLVQAIRSMGADPTAVTPAADVSAVANMGLLQVVSDPRTTLAQCLNALLTAELTDYAAWELLINLTEHMGQDEWSSRFRQALAQEAEHRELVQGWLQSVVLAEAT